MTERDLKETFRCPLLSEGQATSGGIHLNFKKDQAGLW